MGVVVAGVAAALFALLIAGWVLLLLGPFLVAAGGAAYAFWARHARQLGRKIAQGEPAQGILSLVGLGGRGRAEERLRSDVERVLQLAPDGTRPRACICVKRDAQSYVGVLRLYNTQGHFLLCEAGQSPASVGRGISRALRGYQDDFPAEVGALRERIPECNPETCPLRLRNHSIDVARAAA